MKIYYNPAFTAHCHQTLADNEILGTAIVGNLQLLNTLQQYAGIYRETTSELQRVTGYHQQMLQTLNDNDFIWKSFQTDPLAAAEEVLHWRDTLVENGWKPSDNQQSKKLQLIARLECPEIQNGIADQWAEIRQIAAQRAILPAGTELFVPANYSKPAFTSLLKNLEKFGTVIRSESADNNLSDNALSKLKYVLHPGFRPTEKVVLPKDSSFQAYHFRTDSDAMRYITATEAANDNKLFVCAEDKRFDNLQSYLGDAHSGSVIDNAESSILQLFKLGIGLFEYPANIGTMIAWLQSSVNPLNPISYSLYKAVEGSGGLFNKEWDQAIENEKAMVMKDEKLSEDEKKKGCQDIDKKTEKFAIRARQDIDTDKLKQFCNDMASWSRQRMAFPTVQEQGLSGHHATLADCYDTLRGLIEKHSGTLDYITLQKWVIRISRGCQIPQYTAEKGCRATISNPADMLSNADEVVWTDMFNAALPNDEFAFLNQADRDEATRHGCQVWPVNEMLQYHLDALATPILKAQKRLVLVYADYANNEIAQKHPVLIKLEACISNFNEFVSTPALPAEATETVARYCNFAPNDVDNYTIQLREGIAPRQRETESYSSLNSLIQHPLDYVCEHAAHLQQKSYFDASGVNTVLGSVAHRTIELMFVNKHTDDAHFDHYFEQALTDCGALLLLKENELKRKNLQKRLKEGIRKLNHFIANNQLAYVSSEQKFECPWQNHLLMAKPDMLLKDNAGNPVILDFKTSAPDSMKKRLSENRALQLAIYDYVIQHDASSAFNGKPARTAYVILPEMEFCSCCEFNDIPTIQDGESSIVGNLMDLLENGFNYRWKEQLAKGIIELGEGLEIDLTDYGQNIVEKSLYPIEGKDNTKYENGYSNIKGLR